MDDVKDEIFDMVKSKTSLGSRIRLEAMILIGHLGEFLCLLHSYIQEHFVGF